MTKEAVKEVVRQRYAAAAIQFTNTGDAACCEPGCCGSDVSTAEVSSESGFGVALYEALGQEDLPDSAMMASLGCDNPTAVASLGPITAEMGRVMNDPGYVDGVLHDGAARARSIAEPVLKETYESIGFLRA